MQAVIRCQAHDDALPIMKQVTPRYYDIARPCELQLKNPLTMSTHRVYIQTSPYNLL